MELKSKIESELLPIVAKPLRYLGNEHNAVKKPDEAVKLRVLLCYTGNYDRGIVDFPFETHYHLLNHHPQFQAERVYAPDPDVETWMREASVPLFSLESRTVADEFDVLYFYLKDVLDFPQMATMLELAGLSNVGEDRNSASPWILGGGPAASFPETIAPWFDAFFPVNSTHHLVEFCKVLLELQAEGHDKHIALSRAAAELQAWVPALNTANFNQYGDFEGFATQKATKTTAASPGTGSFRIEFQPLVPLGELPGVRPAIGEFGGIPAPAAAAEESLQRLFPLHLQTPEKALLDPVTGLYRRTARSGIEPLFGYSSALAETSWKFLKDKMIAEGKKGELKGPDLQFSFGYSAWNEISAALKEQPFQLPVVAATVRLRVVQDVNLRDEELLDAVLLLAQEGFLQIQLRFVLGLPGERSEDVKAIAPLAKKCASILQTFPDTRLSVVLQGFAPMPHTALQWEAAPLPHLVAEKMELVSAGLKDADIGIICEEPAAAAIKTMLARGHRRLASVVEAAAKAGIRNVHDAAKWLDLLASGETNLSARLQPLSVTLPLPWGKIPGAFPVHLLKQEKLLANQGGLSPAHSDTVTLGGGISRDAYRKLVLENSRQIPPGAPPSLAGRQAPIRYGRRGKKVNTTTAIIKRRVRIRYSKTGISRFFSNQDIIKVFDRSARIANIPLVYSQGARPAPKITYAQPLPTGIASIAEYLDMEVELGREADIQQALNSTLPEGIQILQYQGIFAKAPALAAVINHGTYEVALANTDLTNDEIEAWLAQETVIINRVARAGNREIDIRPFITKMVRSDDLLTIAIDLVEGRTARITEVLQSLFAPKGIDFRRLLVQRTGQYIVKNDQHLTPFDVI